MSIYPQITYPITPDEMQALVRRAHQERGELIRQAVVALFFWRKQEIAGPSGEAGGDFGPYRPEWEHKTTGATP